jgi:hypothetical protein
MRTLVGACLAPRDVRLSPHEVDTMRDGMCGSCIRCLDTGGVGGLIGASTAGLSCRPVLAEAAATQMDHAAGADTGRRSRRPRLGVESVAADTP